MDLIIKSLFPVSSSSESARLINLINSYLLDEDSQSMMLSLFITNNNLKGLQNLLCYENPHFDFLLLHCAAFNSHHRVVLDHLVSRKRHAFISFAQKECGPNPSETFWDSIYSTLKEIEAISLVDEIFHHSLPHEFIKAATHLFLFFKHHTDYANTHGFPFLDKILVGGGLVCRFLPFLHKQNVISFLETKRDVLLGPEDFEINLLTLYFELPSFDQSEKN